MKKLIFYCSIYLVLIIVGFFAYQQFNNAKELDIEKGKDIIDKINNNTTDPKWKYTHHKDENLEHEHEHEQQYNEELVDIFRNIESTLSFFIVVLQEEEEELFASMFLPEQYSTDLWEYIDEPFFNNANYKILREINRDGTLVSASYETTVLEGYKKTRESSEVKLNLHYRDGKTVELLIDLVLVGTEHRRNDDIFYIKTSIIEMIEQIHLQTK
ncbi:hypothetical protein ACEK07_00100 [Alcanivoracaceae bacterium MT1]